VSVLIETRESEEAASRHDPMDRWLAVSEPLAIDDDPDWENADSEQGGALLTARRSLISRLGRSV
jgi:hypothetical protein